MTLTPKESSLLKDLKKQEQLCIDKYEKYAEQAADPQLRDLFTRIAGIEQEHLQTLKKIESGKPPAMSAASGGQQKQTAAQQKKQGKTATKAPAKTPKFKVSKCTASEKEQDKFLCNDALSTEKYVSSDYNTSIFEFVDQKARDALNHIQKEEQQHGEQIYNYMSVNGMYQ